MACDVLILNTAVMDFRSAEFEFANRLVGPGGLAKCPNSERPDYKPEQYEEWIARGYALAGGPGNTAPLVAKAGLEVSVAVYLGQGDQDGLDPVGRAFHDQLAATGVDMSKSIIHPALFTGTTFIYDAPGHERGGITYFPGANDDFDFEEFKPAVESLGPTVVYYMYSGLSERGDANGGRDLAEFIAWCRRRGCITIVDSHTLTANPSKLIESGEPVDEYKLLDPLLPELDIFFTSSDEARMIENTLDIAGGDNAGFLASLAGTYWGEENRTRLFGVTVPDGAFEMHGQSARVHSRPEKLASPFMAGEVQDLVGAGDSFRAGLISYISRAADSFRTGEMDFREAVQMGNLFASLYIKAEISDRYGNIRPFDRMLDIVRSGEVFKTFDELMGALDA